MGMAEVRVEDPAKLLEDPAKLLEDAANKFIKLNMAFTCNAISTTWNLGDYSEREWRIAHQEHRRLHLGKEWWNQGLAWKDSKKSWREDKHKALLETAAYLRSEDGRAAAIGYSAFN